MNLIKSTIAGLAMLATPVAASGAEIVHFDSGAGSFATQRSAGSAPAGRLTVTSAIAISQIGILADLSGASQLQFLIFNADTGANLLASTFKSFSDDGLTYKWSDPLNFTFNPGTTYSVGAASSNGASYSVDQQVNSVSGFNFLLGNQNIGGVFGSSTLDTGQACCDVATAFRTDAVTAPVPEPATWIMVLLGFGFVGGAMRSAKRRQKYIVSNA